MNKRIIYWTIALIIVFVLTLIPEYFRKVEADKCRRAGLGVHYQYRSMPLCVNEQGILSEPR